MPFAAILFLALEGGFALLLLWRAGLLGTRRRLLLALALTMVAFVLRGVCLPHETLDYKDFLSQWVDFYRRGGGWRALSYSLGNYNIPYLYFLCFFSYLPLPALYPIKLLSTFFDVLLAYGAMRLLSRFREDPGLLLGCFFTVLFLPTVVLNGALWGQCDSIYTAFALLGLWLALDDRPVLSMLCFTLSFGFKLQAVFLLPITAVLLMRGKFKLWHFPLFPLFYILLVMPGVAFGRPFLDTLTLYAGQTASVGDGLNYNSPSVFAFYNNGVDAETLARFAIAGAVTYMLALLLFCAMRVSRLSERGILAVAFLFAVGIPFLLPHMHDRYFFLADLLSVVLAFVCLPCAPAAPLTQFASLLGYHAYLKTRYLLYMNHGARALIVAMLLVFGWLLYDSAAPLQEGAPEKSAKAT